MGRPVTLFTGQWADMTLEDLATKAADWGYDGLELACWGDHMEIDKACASPSYCQDKLAMLESKGLKVWSISTHLVGQAVADRIDERHQSILPEYIWGDGSQDGVRKRAAEELVKTAQVAKSMGLKVTFNPTLFTSLTIKLEIFSNNVAPLMVKLRNSSSRSFSSAFSSGKLLKSNATLSKN